MSDLMNYKGYFGSVKYSEEDECLHGKLEFIRALINYEAEDVKSLRKVFEEAVDDYLELCDEQGEEPEKPLKGNFNVRTGAELHLKAAKYAKDNGSNLNSVVVKALENFLPD